MDTFARADQVKTITKWISALLLPFLISAFVILYLFPLSTELAFAWTIQPSMTALLMGAGYLGGAYFFWRVVRANRWHTVSVGFVPVLIYTIIMLAATLLHLDRFHPGHPVFVIWLAVYLVTPFLIATIVIVNYANAPGNNPGNMISHLGKITKVARVIFLLVGVFLVQMGLTMFIFPSMAIEKWPWMITPLTTRVLAGWIVLPGLFGIAAAMDGRWSAIRIPIQSQLIGLGLILAGVFRSWSDFDSTHPNTYLYTGAMGLLFICLIVFYIITERRFRAGGYQLLQPTVSLHRKDGDG
jgi:hypothetical protein